MEVALVVDDGAAVRRRVADLLREHQLFEQVDRVVRNVLIPEVDGFTFLSGVREPERFAFVRKPFDPVEPVARVRLQLEPAARRLLAGVRGPQPGGAGGVDCSAREDVPSRSANVAPGR